MKCCSWKRTLAATLITLGLLSPAAIPAAELNVNLTVDGSFENSEVFPGSGPFGGMLLFDWTQVAPDGDDNYAFLYSQFYSGFPEPPGAGLNHYGGGNNTEAGQVMIQQSIFVGDGPSAALIASGNAYYDLRSYFSSYQEQDDATAVRAVFLNAGGTRLGFADVGGQDFVLSINASSGQRDWAEDRRVGRLPIGTASVELQLVSSDADVSHDGYVDLVDFKVANNPILPVLDISVDRLSGVVTLSNRTGSPVNLAGYSITSEAGALDSTGWTSIADTYDANSGGSVDPTNIWTETSTTAFDLTESGGGTGAMLGVGRTVSLGAAWLQNPTEDLVFQYTSNGSPVSGILEFEGNLGDPLGPGDFNADTQLDVNDWFVLRGNSLANLTGLSPVQAYLRGDLNGDLQNNHADFLIFGDLYDAANGPGSFQEMLASLPEPGSLWFISLVGAFAATRRRA